MGVKNVTSTRIALIKGLEQLCIAVLDSLIKPPIASSQNAQGSIWASGICVHT